MDVEKLVGRTVESVFCGVCDSFTVLMMGMKIEKCKACGNDDLIVTVITIREKRLKRETLREKVEKLSF